MWQIMLSACSSGGLLFNYLNTLIMNNAKREFFKLVFIVLCLISTVPGLAQQDSGEKMTWANGWGGYFVNFMVEPLSMPSSNIQFTYFDESPTVDPLIADININSAQRAYGVSLGLEFSHLSGITWNVGGSFTTMSGNNLATFNLGMGYRISLWDKFFLVPMASVGFGNGNFELGSITNISSYVQVNDTQFFSEQVDVKLRDRYGYVAPGLNIVVPVSKKVSIRVGVNYKYAFNRGEEIRFRGYTDSAESESAREDEKLSEDNVYFYLEGERIKDEAQLMEFGGVAGHIGVIVFGGR